MRTVLIRFDFVIDHPCCGHHQHRYPFFFERRRRRKRRVFRAFQRLQSMTLPSPAVTANAVSLYRLVDVR
jgi:hypothetical protein